MKNRLLSILFIFIAALSFAQLNDHSIPPSWIDGELKSTATYVVTMSDINQLLSNKTDEYDKTFEFGELHTCAISLSDFQKINKEKTNRYVLRIEGKDALSLNINFSKFNLQPGTKMWIYSPDRTYKIGAFTWRNVNHLKNFATVPLPVQQLIIEIEEPLTNEGTTDILIDGIVTGYKDFYMDKAGFGQSGNCNVNTLCPEANGWEDVRQSVVMLLTANNTRKCSGTLINNTAADGSPYVLTAKHCNTATNAIFMFNYESPDCSETDGPTSMVLQGCEIMADNAFSDVTLLKLTQSPPPEFHAYYAGWSRDTIPSVMSYSIHHPSGDIKKFSVDSNAVISSGYTNQPDSLNNHWRVLDWNIGTTEAGSSGCPLFNEQQQIIGQLHGGYASCNNQLADYYGRFDVSWDYGATPATRLKEWLDPLQTDTQHIQGMFFASPFYQRDINLLQITNLPAQICDESIQPQVSFISWGSDTVSNLKLHVEVDGQSFDVEWSGQLSFLEQAIINIPSITLTEKGTNEIKVWIKEINNQNDENQVNDTLNQSFEWITGENISISFTTDLYPQENKLQLFTASGSLVWERINFSASTTHNYEICVPFNCYDLIVSDTYGDGICCEFGNGNVQLLDAQEQVLGDIKTFGFYDTLSFCSPERVTPEDGFLLFPNPAMDWVQVVLNENWANTDLQLDIISSTGAIVKSVSLPGQYLHSVPVQGLFTGTYVVKISDPATGTARFNKLIIINP
jgi:lysyl endopeptidase